MKLHQDYFEPEENGLARPNDDKPADPDYFGRLQEEYIQGRWAELWKALDDDCHNVDKFS